MNKEPRRIILKSAVGEEYQKFGTRATIQPRGTTATNSWPEGIFWIMIFIMVSIIAFLGVKMLFDYRQAHYPSMPDPKLTESAAQLYEMQRRHIFHMQAITDLTNEARRITAAVAIGQKMLKHVDADMMNVTFALDSGASHGKEEFIALLGHVQIKEEWLKKRLTELQTATSQLQVQLQLQEKAYNELATTFPPRAQALAKVQALQDNLKVTLSGSINDPAVVEKAAQQLFLEKKDTIYINGLITQPPIPWEQVHTVFVEDLVKAEKSVATLAQPTPRPTLAPRAPSPIPVPTPPPVPSLFEPRSVIASSAAYTYVEEGNRAFGRRDYIGALEAYTKAEYYYKQSGESHAEGTGQRINYNETLVYAGLGRLFEAAMNLERDKDYPDTYTLEGVIWVVRRNDVPALKALTIALEINPRDAVAYYYRSILYNHLGKPREAKADLAKAQALNPDIVTQSKQFFSP